MWLSSLSFEVYIVLCAICRVLSGSRNARLLARTCCEVDYCGVMYFVDREIDLGNSVLHGMLIELSAEGLCLCVGSISIGPDIRQDYPLNLSILISGGRETN